MIHRTKLHKVSAGCGAEIDVDAVFLSNPIKNPVENGVEDRGHAAECQKIKDDEVLADPVEQFRPLKLVSEMLPDGAYDLQCQF